jgi:hypothetical protein
MKLDKIKEDKYKTSCLSKLLTDPFIELSKTAKILQIPRKYIEETCLPSKHLLVKEMEAFVMCFACL